MNEQVKGLIDEYIISIVAVILGQGISLLAGSGNWQRLSFEKQDVRKRFGSDQILPGDD